MTWRRQEPGHLQALYWPICHERVSYSAVVMILRNKCLLGLKICHGTWLSIIMVKTHWDRVTHICVDKLTIIGSDNGLSPGRRQAIIWTNAGILLIRPLGTNFSEILIGIQTFSFTKMYLQKSSAKWRLFCLGLNVLKICHGTWLSIIMVNLSCPNFSLFCILNGSQEDKYAFTLCLIPQLWYIYIYI